MRTALLGLLLAALPGLAQGQEDRTKAAGQKKAAQDAWASMDVGDPAHAETKHLLIFAPKSMEKRLSSVGPLLEKYHDLAFKALTLNEKDAYPGKITVYLFEQKEHIPTFARRVEKRRPMPGETSSYAAGDDKLLAVAAPAGGKNAAPVEASAGEMVASLLLSRKAGVRTSLPEWLTTGFGRATSYRAFQAREKFVSEDRKVLRLVIRKRNASDVWAGSLEAEEAVPLQASLAEFLAYELGSARFAKFVVGFRPGENQQSRTTAQALEEAGIEGERLNTVWKARVR